MRPYAPLLRKWALDLQLGQLVPEDVEKVVKFLRSLASGRSVHEASGVPVKKGAPQSDARAQRVWDAAILARPVIHGGEGMTVGDAIIAVANSHCVTEETVRNDWKSKEGQKIRALAEQVYNPLELPLE